MIKGGVLIAFVIMMNSVYAIGISEVELNPQGTDAGGEWIELYSSEVIALEGYKLVNNDGEEIALNGSFSGYYTLNFNKQWLDNSNEKVLLYKESSLIDETDVFADSGNNQKTWQFCETWQFHEPSKGEKNKCGGIEPDESNDKTKTENKDESKSKDEKLIKVFNLGNKTLNNNNNNNNNTEGLEEHSENISPSVIKLNAKTIKTENDSNLKESSNYALYALLGFGFLLGILFLLRRRKYRNEFRKD